MSIKSIFTHSTKGAAWYESYDCDHLNRIAERLQTKTLPFFSQHLAFEKAKR